MLEWIDHLLSSYTWYRRWRGGQWEQWWIDTPVCSDLWFHNEYFQLSNTRPPLGRGLPTVEDY